MPVIQREGFLSCPKQPCWCKLSLPERAVLDQDGAEKPSAVLASPSSVRSLGFPVNQRRLLHLQLWEMKAVMLQRGGLATLCICRSGLSRMGGARGAPQKLVLAIWHPHPVPAHRNCSQARRNAHQTATFLPAAHGRKDRRGFLFTSPSKNAHLW